MLLLVVDTSGRNGSVALATHAEETNECSIVECVALTGGAFSAELVPRMAALLARHDFDLRRVGGLAVVSGPGSFTGLRIGLAAVKALGEVIGAPIAAVSLLEVLAVSGGVEGKVLTAADAGRTESYVGEYEVRGHRAKLIAESLLTQSELLVAAAGSTVVTSDQGVADWMRARGPGVPERHIRQVSAPGMGDIARIGGEKIRDGETVPPELLEANYIRRSEPDALREKRFEIAVRKASEP
jgi:tRNA threonylcarbamoyladenosine biosynthesis protein TsaB